MIIWVYNSKFKIIEQVIVRDKSIEYCDMKGDRLPYSNISVNIDSDGRYVNIDTENGSEQLPIIKITHEQAIMNAWLNFERLDSNDLPLPSKGSAGAAGLDFGACLKREYHFYLNGSKSTLTTFGSDLIIAPGEQVGISLGFKVEFDKDYALLLYLRSSSGIKGMMLSNLVGVIDSDYREELFALIYNRTKDYITVKHGDRIVQGIMTPIHDVLVTEGKVGMTKRGEGGFGSTGT